MEGPPLRVIAEELSQLKGEIVTKVSGNSKIQQERFHGQRVEEVSSWGKNLFIRFPEFSLKIHFLMFGSYRFNDEKEGVVPRLSLVFSKNTLNLYSCSVKILANSEVERLYDKELDIISENWNMNRIFSLVSSKRKAFICDVLLDQAVFAGVGNIIKNEALFKSKVNPRSIVEKIPRKKLEAIINEARKFSLEFYRTVKQGHSLRGKLTIYRKKTCPAGGETVVFEKTGKTKRISFFCPSHQKLYR